MHPNSTDSRQQAIRQTDQSFLVCAAAGTGKTTTLIERYLAIIGEGQAKPAQIIAITFTEKAADEMRARLRTKLGQPDAQLPLNLVTETLEQLETAPISTVHSFCLRVLRENAQFLELDPNFMVIDEIEEQLLRQELLTNFLYQALENNDDVLSLLLQHFDLKRITEFISLITKQQHLWNIDLREFCSQPFEEIHSNLLTKARRANHETLKDLFTAPEISQLKEQMSITPVKNTEDKLYQALQNFLTLRESWEQNQLPDDIKSALKNALDGRIKGNQSYWFHKDILETFRTLHTSLKEHYDQIKEQLVNIPYLIEHKEEIALTQKIVHLGLRFADYYRDELRRQGKINFDGIETEMVQLLTNQPHPMRAYFSHFKHLLVDEFQDINPIQYRIISLIQSCAPHIITFFVGDEKQSIYRFRGAEVEIFNNLRAQQQERLLYLETNYRSAPQLMAFYNHLFPLFLGSLPPSIPYEVHYPHPINPAKTQQSQLQPAEFIEIVYDDDFPQQALKPQMLIAIAIASRIEELHQQPIIAESTGNRPAEYGDMVVLLRARTHQWVFEKVFRQFAIPYFVVQGIGFYHKREIIDLINFLRVLLNPTDMVALIAVLRSPLVGVSDRTLHRFYDEHSRGVSTNLQKYIFRNQIELVTLTPEEAEPIQRFRELYSQLQPSLAFEKTSRILQRIVDATYYLPFLAAQPDGAQMVANVKKLIELSIDWEYNSALTPIDFIRRHQIYRAQEIREGDANLATESGHAVRIMTIHAAKGLDFPIVFVPFPVKYQSEKPQILYSTQWGLSYSPKKSENPETHRLNAIIEAKRLAAEERRLIYVALTRAKDLVCICSVANSKNKSDSPWQQLAKHLAATSAEGLCQYVRLEASNLKFDLEMTSFPTSSQDKTPTIKLPDDLPALLKPVEPSQRRVHLTATEFAELISEPTQRQSIPKSEPEKILSPTALGSIMHQLFAWWDFSSPEPLTPLLDEMLKAYLLTPEEQAQISKLIQSWIQIVLRPDNPLIQLIRTATSRQQEANLCGHYNGILLEGQTDLLLTLPNGKLSLVDFKSDQIIAHPEPELVAKYQAQLRFYAFILDQCNHLPVADLNIYFIRTGELINLRWSPELLQLTASEIQRLILIDNAVS